MNAYREWLDAKIDPARGVTGFRYIWNQHWIIVLHTAIIVAIMIVAEWLFAIEPRSPVYYLFGVAMILTVLATIGYLWVRRAKLWSQMGSGAVRDRG